MNLRHVGHVDLLEPAALERTVADCRVCEVGPPKIAVAERRVANLARFQRIDGKGHVILLQDSAH